MNVLVLNSGSSTVKFQIIETDLDLIKITADVAEAVAIMLEGRPRPAQATRPE